MIVLYGRRRLADSRHPGPIGLNERGNKGIFQAAGTKKKGNKWPEIANITQFEMLRENISLLGCREQTILPPHAEESGHFQVHVAEPISGSHRE